MFKWILFRLVWDWWHYYWRNISSVTFDILFKTNPKTDFIWDDTLFVAGFCLVDVRREINRYKNQKDAYAKEYKK